MAWTHPPSEDDRRQIVQLCADVRARIATLAEEQRLLQQLVQATMRTRPNAARTYQALLQDAGAEYHRLLDMLETVC